MNPLKKARFRVGHSLRTARDGTTRTAGWVKDGVVSAPGKARDRIGGKLRRDGGGEDGGGAPATSTPTPAPATPTTSSESSNPFGGAVKAIRGNPRVAIAWAAVAVLVLAWIGWTAYVWIENGSTAGVGVLVSWPAAIAALALVASPFVAATLLVRKLSADGGPQMAGAAGIAGGGSSSGGGATTTKKDTEESDGEKGDDDEDSPEASADEDEDDDGDDEDDGADEPDSDDGDSEASGEDDADEKDEASG